MYDLIVIGAGPGGIAAGLTAAMEKLNTLVITKKVAGFLENEATQDFLNYQKLVTKFQQLVKNQKLELKDQTEVIGLEKNIVSFSVEVKNGTVFYAKNIIIASGSSSLDFDHITQKSQDGKIKIDSLQKTSVPRVFALGDVCSNLPKNSLVEIGEGVKVVIAIKNL